ncbi:MAG: hypothetical protein E7607_05980 [Ruminococcaceae bacterium]|nr:hypothetical protein [Oscillospiraceae bacterium]
MKNGVHIDIKLSEDLLRKLLYISEAENRTPTAQFAFMLRNNIAYFEKTKGRIPQSELAKIDISDYTENE